MANITVAITGITDQECADVMTTAIEGGSNYWCRPRNISRVNSDQDYDGWRYESFDAYESVYDDEPSTFLGTVTYDTIRTGVNRIMSGETQVNNEIRDMVLANFQDDEPMDADCADAVCQSGIFGSLVYG